MTKSSLFVGLVAAGLVVGCPVGSAATVSMGGAVTASGTLMMIPVTYSCSASEAWQGLTGSAQNSANGTVGFGSSGVTCDDSSQWAMLSVIGVQSQPGDLVSYTVTGPGSVSISGTFTAS